MQENSVNYKRVIILVAVAAFIHGLSIGIDFVIAPLMFEEAGLNKTIIGALLAIEISAPIFIAPLLPKFASKYGIKRILIGSMLCRNIMLMLLPAVHSIYYWMFVMLIFGLGGFTFFSTIQIWVNSVCSNNNRGVSLGVLSAAVSLGITLGPMILKLVGISGTLPFICSGALGLIAFIPLYLIINTLKASYTNQRASILSVIKRTPSAIAGGFTVDFIFFSLSSFIVIYGIEHGLSKEDASFLVTSMLLGSILLDIPGGWIADRVNRKHMMVVCAIIILACSQAIRFVIHSEILSGLVFALWLGSAGSLYTCALALLGDRFKNNNLVAANSAFAFTNCLGGISGVLLSGAAIDFFGPEGLNISISIIAALYIGITLTVSYVNKLRIASSN
jgi:MFS family permease